MAARKGQVTRPTDASVAGFLAGVPDQRRREDAGRLCAMMQEVTGEPPAMWGTSIIGFGTYHYRYASGHEGDAPLAGFSPRSQHLVIYLASEFGDRYQAVLARLGPHKAGKGCLYIKRLGQVDQDALRELIPGQAIKAPASGMPCIRYGARSLDRGTRSYQRCRLGQDLTGSRQR